MAVGSRAWDYAVKYAPSVVNKAKEILARSSPDKSVEQLVNSKSATTQAVVVKTLLDSGLPVHEFVRQVQLTADEARQYAQMIASAMVKQRDAVDSRQTPETSTGDVEVDRTVRNVEIEDMLDLLGVSSDNYATLLRCLNSHTSNDVEKFQLDRQIRRQAYR